MNKPSIGARQGLRLRRARPHHAEAHVPRVPVRHTGPHDRQHAARHLQEDHDRALAAPEPGQARRRQRPDEPRGAAHESAHRAPALPQKRTGSRQWVSNFSYVNSFCGIWLIVYSYEKELCLMQSFELLVGRTFLSTIKRYTMPIDVVWVSPDINFLMIFFNNFLF